MKFEGNKTYAEVKYKGNKYPLRIFSGDYDTPFIIGTTSLSEQLIDKDSGQPKGSEEEYIDLSIYYYVSDDEIDLDEDKLIELLHDDDDDDFLEIHSLTDEQKEEWDEDFLCI